MIMKREEVEEQCRNYGVPLGQAGTIERYLFDRIPGGDFFNSVVCNDLCGAFARADERNALCMKAWIELIYNEFPANSWGTPARVHEWLSKKD